MFNIFNITIEIAGVHYSLASLNIFSKKQKIKEIEEPFYIEESPDPIKEKIKAAILAPFRSQQYGTCKMEIVRVNLNETELPVLGRLDVFYWVGKEVLLNSVKDITASLFEEFQMCLFEIYFEKEIEFKNYVLNKALSIIEDWWCENAEYQKGDSLHYFLLLMDTMDERFEINDQKINNRIREIREKIISQKESLNVPT